MEKKRREALKGDRAMESGEQQLSWAQEDKEGGGPAETRELTTCFLTETLGQRGGWSVTAEKREGSQRGSVNWGEEGGVCLFCFSCIL